MTENRAQTPLAAKGSSARVWARAIEMTAGIARRPDRVLPTVIDERAAEFGENLALLSDRESLSYRTLAERSNRYARWALAHGLDRGEVVALLMPNCPDYLAIWLGITKVSGVVALLNTNLTGASLAHSINVVAPKHLIVDAGLLDQMDTVAADLTSAPSVWISGGAATSLRSLNHEIEVLAGDPLTGAERRPATIEDRALCIYTSGTTGLPKAATLSHGRLMQWAHWFAGMMGTDRADRMYNCLPMYHSVGGVQAPGAMLVAGGSVVLAEKFSARRFWDDITRWDCTIFQYIGELCRYLLHTQPSPQEFDHHIRMACGNGLRADVWNDFQNRFRIPRILEFYASTEGNVSLFNVEDEPGAIGRVPTYLAHRFAATLVKFDFAIGEPLRNEQGFCTPCAANEVGEAIGRIQNDPANFGARFEGYTSPEASEKKIIRDVFKPGDAWFRTGDLMRKDERGFFYFLDRIGDTFRWKGENVSTFEVAEAICAFPAVKEAVVYGVTIPGTDGRAGMATIVADLDLGLDSLRAHLVSRLPEYARPIFLRIRNQMDVTGTFKYTKTGLPEEGYDPSATADPIYFYDPEFGRFVRLDSTLYERIQSGDFHSVRRQPRSDLTSGGLMSSPTAHRHSAESAKVERG